jgi:hypothetical protein
MLEFTDIRIAAKQAAKEAEANGTAPPAVKKDAKPKAK